MNIRIMGLLKFGEKENIENLLNKGEIYMRTIQSFRQDGKQGIGDRYEGTVQIRNIKNAKVTLHLPNKPIKLIAPNIEYESHLKGHIGNIFSTYALSNFLLKRKTFHRIDNRMSLFGSHCLMIKNVKGFTERLIGEIESMGLECSHGLVKYRNFKRTYDELNLFNKSHLLDYQKEHRIIAWTKKDEILKFNIGSLEDFGEIYETDKIIKGLSLDYN